MAAVLKEANPSLKIGFVGAKVAVQPGESLLKGAPAVDFVARNEFDFTMPGSRRRPRVLKDDRRHLLPQCATESWSTTRIAKSSRTWTQLPFVTDVYKPVTCKYRGLLHRVSACTLTSRMYTGRGCKSRAARSASGRRRLADTVYRVRSPAHVAAEIAHAQKLFPQVREFFFDDDTFTDNLPRAEAIAKRARQAWA